MHRLRFRWFVALALFAPFALPAGAAEPSPKQASPVKVGLARRDVTPTYPIRMSGYSNRKNESEGVEQRLWVKALAIGDEHPVVLLTLDNCGMTPAIRDEVARRLRQEADLPPERLAICVSHTHTGPVLDNSLPGMFAAPLPPEHRAHVAQYTRELIDHLAQAGIEALAARKPALLSWGVGEVGFAVNRRVLKDGHWTGFGVTVDGAVDHSLPLLVIKNPDGRLRAVVVNYACHCTTLGGSFNKICGDWAGYAQEIIEREHPGAAAFITIGCGADANPQPREQLAYAVEHGQAVAREVARLLGTPLRPVSGTVAAELRQVEIPFAPLPTRAQWEQALAAGKQPEAYRAEVMLARLDRGEKLPAVLPYTIQTWRFGDDLAMVFLAGEVVVDYALRLKRELDPSRLWITAYANVVPCYIASRRVIAEGGYEVDRSMCFYGQPTQLAPEVEDIIIRNVIEMLPSAWRQPTP